MLGLAFGQELQYKTVQGWPHLTVCGTMPCQTDLSIYCYKGPGKDDATGLQMNISICVRPIRSGNFLATSLSAVGNLILKIFGW